MPDHPLSRFLAGPPPNGPLTSQVRRALTPQITQNQPYDHPLPLLRMGKVGANVNVAPPPQIISYVMTSMLVKEQPFHPLPLLRMGKVGANVNVRSPGED